MKILLSTLLPVLVFAFSSFALAQDLTAPTPAIEGDTVVVEPALLPEQTATPADVTTPSDVITTEGAPVPDAAAPAATEAPLVVGDTPPVPTTAAPADTAASPASTEIFKGSKIDVNKIDSLFFSKWEHDLLVDARKGLTTRPVTPGDTGGEVAPAPENAVFGPREVMLSGIAYVSSENWTIWVNGMQITPTAIPNTIMDLKVYKDHVDLEWLDEGANKIYPIRLRPYQKFNLDTRMFLPAGG